MDRPTAPHRIDFHAPDGSGLEQWEEMNPDNLESGTPVQRGYLCDEIGGYIAGVWDCTAFVDHPTNYGVDEFMYLLEGSVIMAMPDGSEVEVKAGEAFVIPKGLACQWKQPGYVRKIFMILDAPEAKPACNPALERVTVPDLASPKGAEGSITTSRTDFVNAAGNMRVSVSAHGAVTSAASPAAANQVIYVLDGTLKLTHDGKSETFAKDEAVYLPQGCVTGWQTEDGTRLLVSSYVN
jgi:uncharacterized cupin superfamily protein